MLPFCDRHVRIPRSKYLPSHNRGIPVPKQPETIGGHLRRRRLQLKILQREAAHKLKVSTVTLSRWERDTVYPAWPHQPRIIEYLGYDPFTDPELGRPKGNETPFVANLSPNDPVPLGPAIRKRRIELKKNQEAMCQGIKGERQNASSLGNGRTNSDSLSQGTHTEVSQI